MIELAKYLHIAAAIFWVGGMAFMIFVMRPTATAQLAPPQRLPLIAAAMGRFFRLVWASIAVLLATGGWMMGATGMKGAPVGWHIMLGIGVLMMLVFAHIYFAGFKRLKLAVAASNWPEGGRRVAQIATLVHTKFALAWLAIAAVIFIK